VTRYPLAGAPPAEPAVPDVELALLADACLDGAECLYDPYLHEGPDDPASEPEEERAVREQVAVDVCATCPAHQSCLEYALRVRPARGVWAGLTATQVSALADWLGVEVEGDARPQPPSTVPPASHLTAGQLSIPRPPIHVEHAHTRPGVA
jgi:WhiB family transcriptional regulator, redox-sensing transcriptional regulator